MRTYEKVAGFLGGAGLGAAFGAVSAIEGGAGAWAWWLTVGAMAAMVGAMVLVKVGYRKEVERERISGRLRARTPSLREREGATYRKLLERVRPELCHPHYCGGCYGCPGDFFDGGPKSTNRCYERGVPVGERCRRCWDREVKSAN